MGKVIPLRPRKADTLPELAPPEPRDTPLTLREIAGDALCVLLLFALGVAFLWLTP